MINRKEAKRLVKTEEEKMSERHVQDALKLVEADIKQSAEWGKSHTYITRGYECNNIPISALEFVELQEELRKLGYDVEKTFKYTNTNDTFQIKFG